MYGRVQRLVVNKDWRNMGEIAQEVLRKIGATSSALTTETVGILLEEDAERCDKGLPPKPNDSPEVRLARMEKSAKAAQLFQEGKRVEGAAVCAVGCGANWGLAINCYERLTYCDVAIVALSTPEEYAPSKFGKGRPGVFGYPNDLQVCQEKSDEAAELLHS